MGVKDLWPMLESVKKPKQFREMEGETLAVDLSMWIVDSQCVKQMAGTVTRPHLRTSNLLQAGILPVFVIEGDAPELKWQTMADRQQVRQGKAAGAKPAKTSARKASRSHFKTVIKECCEMLDYLGVPHIQSCGEAEATCAALNALGLVDAVVTEDGDAFLYGARTVYKNFTTTKTPGVDSYSMDDIEKDLQLSRNHMIAIGLLIGCDYCPKGVPGVGKAQAMKLCVEVSSTEILNRMRNWATGGPTAYDSPVEKPIAQKINKMRTTYFPQIIDEFMNKNCRVPKSSGIGSWRKPLLSKAQDYNLTKIEWPINYTLEKMLPLLSLYSMTCVEKGIIPITDLSIRPAKIVKKRVRHGIPCLEILWDIDDPHQVDDEDEKTVELVTIETMELVQKCYPARVQQFLDGKTAKASKTKKPSRKQKADTEQSQIVSSAVNSEICNGVPNYDPIAELGNSLVAMSIGVSACHDQVDDKNSPESFSEFDISGLCEKVRATGDVSDDRSWQKELEVKDRFLDLSNLLSDNRSDAYSIESVMKHKDDIVPKYDNESIVIELSDDESGLKLSGNQPSPISSVDDQSEHRSSLTPQHIGSGRLKSRDANPSPLVVEFKSTPHIFTKTQKRNSIDDLLADISNQLNTPARQPAHKSYKNSPYTQGDYLSSPNPEFDSILTGYVTPAYQERTTHLSNIFTPRDENSLHNAAKQSFTKLSCNDAKSLGLGDSTIPLFDVNTLETFTDSELSLFEVQSTHASLHPKTPHHLSRRSVTKSTPLNCITNKSSAKHETGNVTYGNFDIIPQLSALSFDTSLNEVSDI